MNVLNGVEGDRFHATRENYPQLGDSEWKHVGRMSFLMGEPVISGMLESLDRDGQHTAINKYLKL